MGEVLSNMWKDGAPRMPSALQVLAGWGREDLAEAIVRFRSSPTLAVYPCDLAHILGKQFTEKGTAELYSALGIRSTQQVDFLSMILPMVVMSDQSYISKVTFLFSIADFNSSGTINRPEFYIALRSLFKGLSRFFPSALPPSGASLEKATNRVFDKIDEDRSGLVDLEEILVFAYRSKGLRDIMAPFPGQDSRDFEELCTFAGGNSAHEKSRAQNLQLEEQPPSHMFEPLRLNGLSLKNRIIKAATHDGGGFEELRKTYVRLARNDVALITVAYVAVSRVNKTFDNQHHIGDDNMAEWTNLTAAVKAAGGKMSAQLHHPGLFCMSSTGIPMGPSFFYLPSKAAWPKTLSAADIQDIKQEFVQAAVRCKQAGFHCVELHCGHGYLLSQFLTPAINRRTDNYGGSAEKRAQLPVEIAREIRSAVGADFPLVVKLNAEDGLPFPGGLHIADALVAARLLAEAGVDAVIPSFGYTSLNGFGMLRGGVPLDKMSEALPSPPARWIARTFGKYLVPKIEFESLFLEGLNYKFVELLKDTACKVIYVGGADSFQAITRMLQAGNCAVQLGRPLIREPFFVKKIAKELKAARGMEGLEVKSRCIRCNMCTLASIDPVRFKAGCMFLKPSDGAGIEDIEDVAARL